MIQIPKIPKDKVGRRILVFVYICVVITSICMVITKIIESPIMNRDKVLSMETSSDKISDKEYEKLESFIENYLHSYVDAVNKGDFSLVKKYLVKDAKLYKEQSHFVLDYYKRGISETLHKLDIIGEIDKVNDKEYRVKTYEQIGIITNDKEEIKDFYNTYVLIKDGDSILIREMLRNN